MNRIIIELAQEDRERLDRIAAALEGTLLVEAEPEEITPIGAGTIGDGGAGVKPEPKPIGAGTIGDGGAGVKPEIKMSDIQKRVVELAAAGKKAQVREIVKSYAERVSEIPEEKLAEVLGRLNALGGEEA